MLPTLKYCWLYFVVSLVACSVARAECNVDQPLRCTTYIGEVVPEFGEWIGFELPSLLAFDNIFDSACVKHDFCYRYGSITYDESRKDCDVKFLKNMLDSCDALTPDGIPIISDILDVTSDLLTSCRPMAYVYYEGVRKFGSDSFKTGNTDGCCEYESNSTLTCYALQIAIDSGQLSSESQQTFEEIHKACEVPATTAACMGYVPRPERKRDDSDIFSLLLF